MDAIERMQVCTEMAFASEVSHVTVFRDDAVTLLAEVERLQSVEWRTNEHRAQASANFDALMEAKAEVERLRSLLETRARVLRRVLGAEEERTEERDEARAEAERLRAGIKEAREDQRIEAWLTVADHDALADCSVEDRPLLDAVLDKITALDGDSHTLRAEREALHSDETRKRLVAAVSASREQTIAMVYGPLTLPADSSDIVDAVLSVLSGDPEADQ